RRSEDPRRHLDRSGLPRRRRNGRDRVPGLREQAARWLPRALVRGGVGEPGRQHEQQRSQEYLYPRARLPVGARFSREERGGLRAAHAGAPGRGFHKDRDQHLLHDGRLGRDRMQSLRHGGHARVRALLCLGIPRRVPGASHRRHGGHRGARDGAARGRPRDGAGLPSATRQRGDAKRPRPLSRRDDERAPGAPSVRWDRGSGRPFVIGGSATPAIRALLIANVAVFLFQTIARALVQVRIERLFGLVPYDVVHHLFVWQLATYMFLHGGFFHIAFNLLALWMFGTELESLWGTRKFLRFYFITGIGAAVMTTLVGPNSYTVTIGASGAIYGLLAAYGLLFPDRIILLYFVLPIR